MSFISWIKNLGNKVISGGEKIISSGKKDANKAEGVFKSLGQTIADSEQTIESDITDAVLNDLFPIIEGIASLSTVSNAEEILRDPFGDIITDVQNNLKTLTVPTTPFNIPVSGDSNLEAPVITLTPKISLTNYTGPLVSYSVNYFGDAPSVTSSSVQGGLNVEIELESSPTFEIGFNLKIDLKDQGTFQLPSFGYTPGDQSGGKSKQFTFQESDGITSVSAGIGFGGSITYTSNEPKTIELDVSLSASTEIDYNAQIFANYDLGANSIRNIFDLLSNPLAINNLVKGDLNTGFQPGGSPIFGVGITPKINTSVSGKTVDSTSASAIRDALTGLELDLNINPGVTLSAGLIAKEEGTGLSLLSLNLPISLENAISIGLDDQGTPQISDTISVDAGLNLGALGFSVEDAISLPGLVYDIGSLDIDIGKFNLIPTSIADTFVLSGAEQFNLANTLTFDGYKLYAPNS